MTLAKLDYQRRTYPAGPREHTYLTALRTEGASYRSFPILVSLDKTGMGCIRHTYYGAR